MQQNRNDKKRGASEMSYYGPSKDDVEKDVIDCAVSKIIQAFTKDDAPNDYGAPNESPKSSANAGFSFGNHNPFGGKRGWNPQGASKGNQSRVSFQIDAVVSSVRRHAFPSISRAILSASRLKENGQVVSGTIGSDNHADTWCFGPNFVINSYMG